MIEKAVEYIQSNPTIIFWVLVALVIAVLYLYYKTWDSSPSSSRKKKRSRRKRSDDDETAAAIEDGELPQPDDASPVISSEKLDQLAML